MHKTRRLHATMLGLGITFSASWLIPTLPVNAQTEIMPTLTASDAAADHNFGQSVGLSGDYAIVGAPDTNFQSAGSYPGAAYIFFWDGDSWNQQAILTPSDGSDDDLFGFAVAIHGDVAVVGAPGHGGTTGAAYVFRRDGTDWNEEDKLVGGPSAQIGDAVAVEGDRVVAGSPFSNTAYLFERDMGVWSQVTEFSSLTGGVAGDQFGWSVDISGDTVVVGAPSDDASETDGGAAHVFNYLGSWSHQATLQASDPSFEARFGEGVAISGNTVAVGAPGDDQTDSNAGACYVFNRTGIVWDEDTKARSTFGSPANDGLGNAVALDGDVLAVGGKTGGTGDGHVAIFQRVGGAWTEDLFSPVAPLFTGANDQYGTAVAVDEMLLLGGAPGNDGGSTDEGAATFFEVSIVGDPDADSDGLSDATELALQILNGSSCPDIFNPDSDSDGLSDGDEANLYDIDPCSSDSDSDGLDDGDEIAAGTDPQDTDSDDDTLIDGMEGSFGTNPLIPDTDGDGMLDGAEVTAADGSGCPNPLLSDSDGDGFNDSGDLDPCDLDADDDGLSNADELQVHSTNPFDSDTDNDNLLDGAEVALAAGGSCPDPNQEDSDGDGIQDGDEVVGTCGPCDADDDNDGLCVLGETAAGTDPDNPDTDGDGLLDGAEVATGCTDPLEIDSDGDTLLDGAESVAGTNPCNVDTDGDTLPDNSDPLPLIPAITPTVLASMTLATAGEVHDTPVGEFLGPNGNVRAVRRTVLSAQISLAAAAINNGNYNAAEALLTLSLKRVDGLSPPADWMAEGVAKAQIRTDLENLLAILDLIN